MEIKDIVAIVTGVIGCVAGLYSLWRSIRTERMLHLERYFRAMWPTVDEELKRYIERIENLCNKMNSSLSESDIDKLPTTDLEIFAKHEQIDWSYNVKFKKNIDKLNTSTQELIQLSKEFNFLRNMTSVERAVLVGLYDIRFATAETQDKKEEIDELNQRIKEVTRECLGRDEASIAEIKSSPRYKKMLSTILENVRSELHKLNTLITLLKLDIHTYNAIFAQNA